MPESKENVFMNSKLVDKLSKNMLEEIRISILTNDMVDVRIYFFFPQEPEPKTTASASASFSSTGVAMVRASAQ